MPTVTEKTVREIAVENPSSIRVFETLGIDYCCGGKRSLSEACARANADIDGVLLMLEKAEHDSQVQESGDWKQRQLGELIAHIVKNHHGYVRRETPRIEGLLSKVVSKHGPDRREIVRIEELFQAISQELSTHMLKEEQVLFPYIARMEQPGPLPAACFGSVKQPIANMVADHDDAGALLSEIRALSNGFVAPAGACPTFLALYQGLEEFERDLHHHVHLENNVLFPRAVAMEQAR